MNPRAKKPVFVPGNQDQFPGPSLRTIVRKSALLNVTIVLTSCPVLLVAGGLIAVIPIPVIMAGISFLLWTTTFSLYFFLSLPRLFCTPVSFGSRRDSLNPADESGVADRWLDGPV